MDLKCDGMQDYAKEVCSNSLESNMKIYEPKRKCSAILNIWTYDQILMVLMLPLNSLGIFVQGYMEELNLEALEIKVGNFDIFPYEIRLCFDQNLRKEFDFVKFDLIFEFYMKNHVGMAKGVS